ncbi:MAG: dockerin type I repeat-containing protein [Clostridiales bacterium]|nr:dockerin type I repeat-containing protein [Clostridiales bacterium]
MKRLLAVMMALIMAALVFPTALAEGNGIEVTYTGATVDATSVAAGAKFRWTLSVSEASRLWSGQWLIDYPEEFVTPTICSSTWQGSVYSIIQQQIADGNQTSDTADFQCNVSYVGQSGAKPVGEYGNLYCNVGMFLTSFDFGGLQVGGEFVRITFRLEELPPSNLLQHDSQGYYFEMPVTVLESKYFVEGSTPGQGTYCLPHETVNTVNGKVYVSVSAPVAMHTVNFYGFDGELLKTQQVGHGYSALAPNVPASYNDENGPHRFFGWDADYSSVTADMDVHAEYVLVGDTNLSGTIETADALLIVRHKMGLQTLTEKQLFAGNVNGDDAVDSADALLIVRYKMGLIDSLG